MEMSKNTSFNLGDHFSGFVKEQVQSGRYGSGSEVMRAGLRVLETQEKNIKALREKLAIGAGQADRGEFVKNFSMDDIQRQIDKK
jgi:antitoxin ParD1/3/4